MRIQFQNSTRPKKAAKTISDETGRPLAASQQAIAKACGYRDWHELESSYQEFASRPSNELLPSGQRIDVEYSVIANVVKQLEVNAGDVQYAISASRLIGSTLPDPYEALEIRRRLFESHELPQAGRREKGAIGKLKTAGRNGEHVILREFGRPTRVVTHMTADAAVADFEYVSPKAALPLFIPMRLYLPYGMWVEPGGSKILFSRDYFPLWRLREQHAPERVSPWLWIKHVEQSWFWSDSNTPWSNHTTYRTEMERLKTLGIHALPLLAEALPLIIRRDDVRDFTNAVPILQEAQSKKAA